MAGSYPSLVEPLIPDAQKNMGAHLFLEGLNNGLSAFARFAQMRRESELETQRLLQQNRLAEEQHGIEKQKLSQDFQLREEILKSHQQLQGAQIDLLKARTKAVSDGTAYQWQRAAQLNEAKQGLLKEMGDDEKEWKLNDPEFMTKDPAGFAVSLHKFESKWGYGKSVLPEINNEIKKFNGIADTQKIKLPNYDENGKRVAGFKDVPIKKIVQGLSDESTRESYKQILRDSGLLKEVSPDTVPMRKPNTSDVILGVTMPGIEGIRGLYDYFSRETPKSKKDVPSNPAVQQWLDSSKKWETMPSRLPPNATKNMPSSWNNPAPQIPQDAGTTETLSTDEQGSEIDPQASAHLNEPSDTDKILTQAKNAISLGAPINAVAQMLQNTHGIDPTAILS